MDNIVNMGQNDVMSNFTKTDDIMNDMRKIIEGSQKTAHQAVNTILVQRNWLIGYRIASEELNGEDRADYGAEVIKKLSFELTKEFGKGYTKSNLYSFYSFYKTYPEIFQTVSGKSAILLSWSHYNVLLQVKDKIARDWYEKEAYEQTWSVRTLQRNISSQYYYRMLQTQNRNRVENEMKQLTADFQTDKLEFIKNPVIAEFWAYHQIQISQKVNWNRAFFPIFRNFLWNSVKDMPLSQDNNISKRRNRITTSISFFTTTF